MFTYLPVSWRSAPRSPPLLPSIVTQLHRSLRHLRKEKGHWQTDKTQETFPFPACLPGYSAHLIPLCRCSRNLLFVLHLQCLAKVFIPLQFFHILLCYCLMLNCFKLLFSHINLQSIHRNDKVKNRFLTSLLIY